MPTKKKKYISYRQKGYDDLFDEVCLQLEGKYIPSEENREVVAELINDTIKIAKRLSTGKIKNDLKTIKNDLYNSLPAGHYPPEAMKIFVLVQKHLARLDAVIKKM